MVLFFVWRDGVMLPVTIFPVYDLFSQLASTLAEQIPVGIRTWLDVGVATNRIEVIQPNSIHVHAVINLVQLKSALAFLSTFSTFGIPHSHFSVLCRIFCSWKKAKSRR